MQVERLSGLISLKKMEYRWIVLISCQTVVHYPLFGLCQSGGLLVDRFNLIGVRGVGVNLHDGLV